MSDVSDQQKLDLALAVSNRAQAEDALRLLHAMAEPDRRRVLRPHWEDPERFARDVVAFVEDCAPR